MRQFKTLQRLPGIPVGTIGFQRRDMIVFVDKEFPLITQEYSIKYIEEYPDFFKEVKEEPKLFTLSDLRKLYYCYFSTNDEQFIGAIRNLFPHIKID